MDWFLFETVCLVVGLTALWRFYMNKGDKSYDELKAIDNVKIKEEASGQ